MIRLLLGSVVLMCMIQSPILAVGAVVVACACKPDLFKSNRRGIAITSGNRYEEKPEDPDHPEVVTAEYMQARTIKECIKPDWDPMSPENQERIINIRKGIKENIIQAEKDMVRDIQAENLLKYSRVD